MIQILILVLQGAQAVYKYSEKLDILQPVQSCKTHSCEFCCLSTGKCGSLVDCKDREMIVWAVTGIFYFVVGICLYIFITISIKQLRLTKTSNT